MPPIPVRIDDPITPSKPPAATSQISESSPLPSGNNATTSSTNVNTTYPPARPGAAPGPAPTSYIPPPQPAPSRTQPGIAAIAPNIPPPPQPGAVPSPYYHGQQAPTTIPLPPPPKAGESRQFPVSTPAQMRIPPPEQNYSSTHSTTTAGYAPPPSTLNLGPVTSPAQQQHSAGYGYGYHQNTSAQEMSSAQRTGYTQPPAPKSEGILGGLGGDAAGETAGDVWKAVRGWVGGVGEKLVETEESVWRAINGR